MESDQQPYQPKSYWGVFPTEAPLYDPRFEHDACGIGFVADLSGRATFRILDDSLRCLERLAHRGAIDADGKSGDGAGILCSIPNTLMNRELERMGKRAVAPGELAVGMLFLPREPRANMRIRNMIAEELQLRGLEVLAWRTVVHDPNVLGQKAIDTLPDIQQILMARPSTITDELTFDRQLYLVRRRIENHIKNEGITGFHIPSFSCRTVVYKALVLAQQLRRFYIDLSDPDFKVSVCVFHQRYATNTFPTWERAQPFRFMCHNGEINTVQGNANWMRAREASLESLYWGSEITHLRPIIDETTSDTGMFDNALELLTLGGRDIRHAMKMMVPQAWEKDPDMPTAQKGFYRYHASLMEPWDGPASLLWTDGALVGFQLDRNGLRPARYLKTNDGIVYAGSEIGALDVDPDKIELAGKIGPGQMICADLKQRKFMTNDEIMRELAGRKPYREWAQRQRVRLEDVADIKVVQRVVNPETLLQKQAMLGWTSEELTMVIKTMYEDAAEPVGSMGDDTPHAVLSPKPRPMFNYFKQRFAEVTNPPIDHLREDQVMSLRVLLGARGNVLEEREEHAHLIRLNSPILRNEELRAIVQLGDVAFKAAVLDATFEVVAKREAGNLQTAVMNLCKSAEKAIKSGVSILILSDKDMSEMCAPIPALLAVGAVHHYLVRVGLRWSCSLIVESGEAREVHHMAALIGFGANAVNPYLALDTAREAIQRGKVRDKTMTENDAVKNYIKACEKGLMKIMSKMGIAAVDAYCGAQIFEAVGLGAQVVNECFTGTPSRIGGIGYAEIEAEVLKWHANVFRVQEPIAAPNAQAIKLDHPGFYKERAGGEPHGNSQKAVHALQKAVRVAGIIEYTGDDHELVTGIARTKVKDWRLNGLFADAYKHYKEFSALYSHADGFGPEGPIEPRDLLEICSDRAPITLDEVEPIAAIVKRFSSAAMSLGSLSPEAHETLAIAMTRLGGMSNSGEGGEEARRFENEGNSGIKQVASGRFGVTPAYLMSASELQIKMAQGSKPGEGGQIPGHKVTELIAKVRHTVPGVALISPPPHHDIYSIEDLSQLIYDLRQINPQAKISVKLVAQAGVGTIAAGVAKALADVVLISGHSGGTGASPLSSIKNAGMPWELGLAETQQTLLANNLRGRVRVRTDGGLRTGRDVMIAALLGADEMSFGTVPLIAEGCIMARVCHLNTCPAGVATQKPELRAKFVGKPEHVMAYLCFVAHEVREYLAQMGYRSLSEVIGHTNLLKQRDCAKYAPNTTSASQLARLASLSLGDLLAMPYTDGRALSHNGTQVPTSINDINESIVKDASTAIEEGWTLRLHYSIRNQDRSIGATLAGAITKTYGDKGLPAGTIEMDFRGYAGQSFGAFTTNGMRLHLIGAANDYVGKGMRGGEISLRPFPEVKYAWQKNHIMGNTALYGATGGALFAAGKAGERFAVRNSGACGVIEGVGDNGLEYMTGGVIVVLGSTGRNFAAGMTGGMAFVYDPEGTIENRVNHELVDVDRLTNPGMVRLVQRLLKRHYELTNSHAARHVLRNWGDESLNFWRILPKDRVAEIESENEFSDFQVT
jgi:glutamate synthase (ferredoxin)